MRRWSRPYRGGALPDPTCPLIDQAIAAVKEAVKTLERRCESGCGGEDAAYELRDVEGVLEQIRAANLTLRQAAEWWEFEAHEAQGVPK